MPEIVIIGAGASGMAAAITAAEDTGNRVTLIERQARVGRKLLSTGNGRCNLTNISATLSNYHGGDPDFASAALGLFPPADNMAFFQRLGLLCVPEYGGRVFPMSNQAASVLDVLRYAVDVRGVKVITGSAVTGAGKSGGGFYIDSDSDRLRSDKLIIACGGLAGGKLGGVKDGYELLKSFGHECTKLYPALTQIRTAGEYPRALKGVKAVAGLKLVRKGNTVAENCGEVLFTETGVSGTAVFEVSRFASAVPGAEELILDFFPHMNDGEVQDYVNQQAKSMSAHPAIRVLTGSVHNRLGQMLCKAAGISGEMLCADLGVFNILRLVDTVKGFGLQITGVSGFDSAQVTAGGIKTDGFFSDTMQSRLVPGLYACGEVLDIDGDCGGYNLQWAWSSGRLAGLLRV